MSNASWINYSSYGLYINNMIYIYYRKSTAKLFNIILLYMTHSLKLLF